MVYKYIANANTIAHGQKMMNTKRILDEEKVKDFIGDFNKHFEDLTKRYKKDAEKIKTHRECFWRKYPEIFRDSPETEVDVDEGQTRLKKPNLAEIREKVLHKRTAESFKDYQGVMFDSTLSLIQKIIKLQEAIEDTTRRKIHCADLQGQLLEDCFRESKEAHKRMLEQVNIKKQWALFLCKLHKLVLEFNQNAFCTVSLHFICYNFKAIEEICKSDPDNWK